MNVFLELDEALDLIAPFWGGEKATQKRPDASMRTLFFGEDFRGRAVRTDSWICIDSGAAAGGSPMLLRLDDLQEFY